jgi:hypothetical protein
VWDHLAKWLASTLGEVELDHRFMAQLPSQLTTVRVFDRGLSSLSQVSGREHRKIQKSLVAAVFGHDNVTNEVLNATRSLIEYIYTAQMPAISQEQLLHMADILYLFHDNKDIFIQNGSRGDIGHLNIPKIHALSHILDDILRGGTPDNHST